MGPIGNHVVIAAEYIGLLIAAGVTPNMLVNAINLLVSPLQLQMSPLE